MKLEDIPKKGVFKVPDGYFDELPSQIQTRIEQAKPVREQSFFYRYKLHYALLAVAFLAVAIFLFTPKSSSADAETLLAAVSTEDLISYLNESEITTDEVFNHIDFDDTDVDEIETEVYDSQLDEIILDGDLDELNLENI
jgi:hypothetical protein